MKQVDFDSKTFDIDWDGILKEIERPDYSLEEIANLNKTANQCVRCGEDTKDLYNFKYCPNNCDKEFNLDSLYTF